MASFASLKNTIYDWVDSQSLVASENIIWQFQNFQIPNKPIFSLRILSFTQVGDAFEIAATSGNSDERDLVTSWDFTLEILGFGKDIVEKTKDLKNSLNFTAVHELLKAGDIISWNNTEPVLDISGMDNKELEERSSYDAFMRTNDIITNINVGQISILKNASGTFKSPGHPDIIRLTNVDAT